MKKKAVTLLLIAATLFSTTACGISSHNAEPAQTQATAPTSTTAGASTDSAASYAPESPASASPSEKVAADYKEPDVGITSFSIAPEMYEATEACSDGGYYDNGIAGGFYDSSAGYFSTEEYNSITENSFMKVTLNPLSTFAADVDTGSYCNLRRHLYDGWDVRNLACAVRTEEMINYFDYEMEHDSKPFQVKYEMNNCPWNMDNQLLIMTIQTGDDVNIPSNGNNFVFLIDTSGSMRGEDRLELAKEAFSMLAETITENDRISIVTYSGSSETLLEGSNNIREIKGILNGLKAGGGTNGSGGIVAAYECAKENFIEGGNNRVIIASDGDMNLGITSQGGLVDLISEKKDEGVFLTVLGFGTGNYSDANMESLADAGNGNYSYIDCLREAKHVLVEQLTQTTVTVAKDVKFQAEFNPAVVASYRQIGYENRQMAASDFADDTKDGGEIGAGQQVTIAYEISLVDNPNYTSDLKYQTSALTKNANTKEICTVSVRYKNPSEDVSNLLEFPIENIADNATNEYFGFISGIIEASMIFRDSEYKGDATYKQALALAERGSIKNEYREEFCYLIELMEKSSMNEYNPDYDYDIYGYWYY